MCLKALTILGGVLPGGTAIGALYEPMRGPFTHVVVAGDPKGQIVIPDQPTYLEEFAAAELQAYIERMSGARMPVQPEGDERGSPYSFFLGGTREASRVGVQPVENEAKFLVPADVPGAVEVLLREWKAWHDGHFSPLSLETLRESTR